MFKMNRYIVIQAATAILAYVAPLRPPVDVRHLDSPDLAARAAVARDCAAAQVETV